MMKKTLCEFKKSSELNYFSVEVSKRVCMEEKVFQTPEGKSVLILVNLPLCHVYFHVINRVGRSVNT